MDYFEGEMSRRRRTQLRDESSAHWLRVLFRIPRRNLAPQPRRNVPNYGMKGQPHPHPLLADCGTNLRAKHISSEQDYGRRDISSLAIEQAILTQYIR
jgi:hypothetical protein